MHLTFFPFWVCFFVFCFFSKTSCELVHHPNNHSLTATSPQLYSSGVHMHACLSECVGSAWASFSASHRWRRKSVSFVKFCCQANFSDKCDISSTFLHSAESYCENVCVGRLAEHSTAVPTVLGSGIFALKSLESQVWVTVTDRFGKVGDSETSSLNCRHVRS